MRYDKSRVMKRAWEVKKKLYPNKTFSEALKWAWEYEKEEYKYQRRIHFKRRVYAEVKVHKKDGRARVVIDGDTYKVKEELKAEGFKWNPEKYAWIKIFKNINKARTFLYFFNCEETRGVDFSKIEK
jgi:hypothetical protein